MNHPEILPELNDFIKEMEVNGKKTWCYNDLDLKKWVPLEFVQKHKERRPRQYMEVKCRAEIAWLKEVSRICDNPNFLPYELGDLEELAAPTELQKLWKAHHSAMETVEAWRNW